MVSIEKVSRWNKRWLFWHMEISLEFELCITAIHQIQIWGLNIMLLFREVTTHFTCSLSLTRSPCANTYGGLVSSINYFFIASPLNQSKSLASRLWRNRDKHWKGFATQRRLPPKPFSGDVTGGCRYLGQICSVWVRVKRRVLSGMSTFRISSMKNDRTTPLTMWACSQILHHRHGYPRTNV